MPKRILTIDDDEDIVQCIDLVLSQEGYTVQTAMSPEEIDSLIFTFNPDLILLDINIGEYDGLKICKKLKSQKSTSSIPIVVVSSDSRIKEAVDRYGATDVIEKPFGLEQLVDTIGAHSLAKVVPIRSTPANH